MFVDRAGQRLLDRRQWEVGTEVGLQEQPKSRQLDADDQVAFAVAAWLDLEVAGESLGGRGVGRRVDLPEQVVDRAQLRSPSATASSSRSPSSG